MPRLLLNAETKVFEDKATNGLQPMNAHRLEWSSCCWHQIESRQKAIVKFGQSAQGQSSHALKTVHRPAAQSFDLPWHANRAFQCLLVSPQAFAHKEPKIANRIGLTNPAQAPCLANRGPLSEQALYQLP